MQSSIIFLLLPLCAPVLSVAKSTASDSHSPSHNSPSGGTVGVDQEEAGIGASHPILKESMDHVEHNVQGLRNSPSLEDPENEVSETEDSEMPQSEFMHQQPSLRAVSDAKHTGNSNSMKLAMLDSSDEASHMALRSADTWKTHSGKRAKLNLQTEDLWALLTKSKTAQVYKIEEKKNYGNQPMTNIQLELSVLRNMLAKQSSRLHSNTHRSMGELFGIGRKK